MVLVKSLARVQHTVLIYGHLPSSEAFNAYATGLEKAKFLLAGPLASRAPAGVVTARCLTSSSSASRPPRSPMSGHGVREGVHSNYSRQ